MATTRTVVTLDATAFGEFLEHMALYCEAASVQAESLPSVAAFDRGSASAYRALLGTVQAMADNPADSAFVVQS